MGELYKQYTSEKETIIEALEDIENFVDRMEVFMKTYSHYRYTIDINKSTKERSGIKWIVDLKIIKNEHEENIKVT